jgi:Rps23 Pro-64 3,4-dihydroxylase Tpa1-like proline 4-hydroxylase
MAFDHKIKDLKFHINKLVPEDVCKYFIDFYEKNNEFSVRENSYKFKTKKREEDNFKCINLTDCSLKDKKFIEPLELAKRYVSIMITNYVLYIQKNICPTFDSKLISKSYNLRILKYEKGQFINDHCDHGINTRASCTLNLNKDYEGGQFRFFDGQIKHSFKTGDAMIFPAEPIWIHGTEPITQGVRYSINCFLSA